MMKGSVMTLMNEIAQLEVVLPVRIRTATAVDVVRLEWYGQYAHHRNLFRKAYRDQQLGKRLILVADCKQFPIGRIFILFILKQHGDGGSQLSYLYSLRVMEMFRNQGIGSRLIAEAEQKIAERGYNQVTIGVAKTNLDARRLYERLGYQVYSDDPGQWSYTDHLGNVRSIKEPCWLLQKQIRLR